MQRNAYVTGWGAFLPNAPVDNASIESVLGHMASQSTSVKRRVLLNNGIATRHYAIDPATGAVTHTNAALTAEAIRALGRNANFPISEIQCLACGSSSADQIIPSHASMVHAELGCPPCEVVGTSGVCASGVSAFKYGYLNVLAGASDNAVVTGSELASPTLRASHFEAQLHRDNGGLDDHPMLPFSNEFLRWMLSDGAGAVLITDAPRPDAISLRIDWVDLVSYANESEVCMYSGMRKADDGSIESFRTVDDGARLFREGFVSLAQDVRVLNDRMPALMRTAVERVKARRCLKADDIDWLLPHYSSNWFRQKLHDGMADLGLPVPFERWFTNLTTKGNTGSAAIYIMLEELMSSGKVQRGQRILGVVPESSRMIFGFIHLTAV
jgi:3-oxoacyl-[acyl-carrier-protein] synthase-3